MDSTVILGIVRHVLTAVGGFLITKGWISGDVEVWVGAVMTLIGLVWSIIDKVNGKTTTVKMETSIGNLTADLKESENKLSLLRSVKSED